MSDRPVQPVSETTDPSEASGLQAGVAEVLVDIELDRDGESKTVKIPQPKRLRRVVFKY